jgi:[acyl-carrier-protein] S-malonyltransferase
MLALLAPGQGAQTPGMLTPWLDIEPAAERLRWSCAVTGIDLIGVGTDGTADDVRDTANAQPLLVALAFAVADALGVADRTPQVVAGHSVGEYAAAALAGAMSMETALVLVRERGRLMAEDAHRHETGMSAVLGGDVDEVLAALDQLGLVAANVNAAGQVVAAGASDALAALAADPPAGARVRALPVAGAFHTPYMAEAGRALAGIAIGAPVRDPRLIVVSNADGAVVTSGLELRHRLVGQVAAPVRWDSCMETFAALGVTAAIELAPGGTLTGLVKRALPGVETVAIRTPDDLASARALIEQHQEVAVTEHAPSWRLAVAPAAGTFHAAPVAPGSPLDQGASVGLVVSNRSEWTVSAAHGGVLVEWLAHDGDPVSPGQPIALLHPEPQVVLA